MGRFQKVCRQLIGLAVLTFVLTGCNEEYKLPVVKITQGNKVWYSQDYRIGGGCVGFYDDHGARIRVCGTYTVEEVK